MWSGCAAKVNGLFVLRVEWWKSGSWTVFWSALVAVDPSDWEASGDFGLLFARI